MLFIRKCSSAIVSCWGNFNAIVSRENISRGDLTADFASNVWQCLQQTFRKLTIVGKRSQYIACTISPVPTLGNKAFRCYRDLSHKFSGSLPLHKSYETRSPPLGQARVFLLAFHGKGSLWKTSWCDPTPHRPLSPRAYYIPPAGLQLAQILTLHQPLLQVLIMLNEKQTWFIVAYYYYYLPSHSFQCKRHYFQTSSPAPPVIQRDS